MSDIGGQLRAAREEQGLSLDQIQKATRIKRAYLEAIEANRFDQLPSPVQVRGFVRSYAGQLGLDADSLLAQIDGAAGPHSSPAPGDGEPAGPVSSARSARPGLPVPVLVIGAIALFALGGLLLISALSGNSPAPALTPLPSVPLSASTAPQPTAPPAPAEVSVTLAALEHVWVRVTQDGVTAFEGTLDPGQPQTWQAEQQIIVETGNGAALNVEVNGEPVGALGPRSQVVVRAWGPQGEVTPSPTATPASTQPEAEAAGATASPSP